MIDFKEVKEYRDLLYFLAIRGIRAKYAQSILGVGWAIIQPLVTCLVFALVFGKVAKLGSDGLPYIVFSYLALWPWNYFSGMLQESSSALISNANLISKVYFPRVILPLVAIFSKLLDFVIAFVIVIGFLIYYRITPGITVLFVPLLIVQLAITSVGLGMTLSALAVKYRDVRYALGFITQLLMYGAPVIYSTNKIPVEWQQVYAINPLVGVIEGFRAAFTNRPMPWEWIWPGAITAVVIFLFGLFYFRKMESQFADVA